MIDQTTADLPHWRGLPHRLLARHGLYSLWRVQRLDLARHAASLQAMLDDLVRRYGLQDYPHAVLPSIKRYTQRGACYGLHA